MKRNYTGNIVVLVLLLVAAMGCKQKKTADTNQEHKQQYTCPMHPKVIKDAAGKCPICGMDLVPKSSHTPKAIDSSLLHLLKPANAQIAADLPTITPESGTRIFSLPLQGLVSYDTRRRTSISSRVSGRIEKLYIKYNYQPVRKGQLLMEIYSPDLAAAQRELIYISRNDNNPSLLQSAKQRLGLLGMQQAQISQVIRTGKPVYSVPVYSSVSGYIVDQTSLSAAPNTSTPMATTSTSSASDGMGMGASSATPASPVSSQPQTNNAPVLVREGQYLSAGQSVFNVYQASSLVADFYLAPSFASRIKRNQRLIYYTLANPDKVFTASIGLIEPTQRNGANFTTARVYISNKQLQPGQLIAARIPVVARGWWLPETAVVTLGNKSVVFKKENEVFVPKNVSIGIRVEGLVQVLDNVAAWQVARNAGYLVGEESFIRTSSNN